MIAYKTAQEIKTMQMGGKILQHVVRELKNSIKVGTSTRQIDDLADKLIKKYGGQPSFKKVKDYHWATCLPVNEEIVHTPPSKRILKDGDVLTIDIGVFFGGFNTDYADTFIVGKAKDEKVKKFLQAGKNALYKAIEKLKKGNRLGEVSKAIEEEIYGHGFFVIKQLTGHGIGKSLHEDPYVLGYLDRPINRTIQIKPGLTVAVEVIYSMGTEEMAYKNNDSWSIKTKDGSLSACFEHSLAVTDKDTLTLT